MKKLKSLQKFDQQVLNELKKKPLTTYDIRKMGPFHPAGVIARLRKRFDIETTRVTVNDKLGISHYRVASYVLNKAKGSEK
jgi:hypothetical protein